MPVRSDLVGSVAVDTRWRLYYNDAWVNAHTVEENAAVLIHEVSHLLREHEARKQATAATDHVLWNTATDCEINDDLMAEGLPLPDDPPRPGRYGLKNGENAETYYRQLALRRERSRDALPPKAALPAPPPKAASPAPPAQPAPDCGSGAHGERRPWELPDDDGGPGGTPSVDLVKAQLVRRDVAQRILERGKWATDIPLGWRRWARETLTPKVDYMATIRHVVRKALRDSTLGRYDRTYSRPHRRQACYGEFIMSSFHQPRPRPGFLIDTSNSMEEPQLARAVAELGGLTRQLGYGAEVIVACSDAEVHNVRKVFSAAQFQLYGGGGTDMRAGLRYFVERRGEPIDLLVVVTDCHTPWPEETPPFPVITIRVGDGAPPSWGERGSNKVITIEDPSSLATDGRSKKQDLPYRRAPRAGWS
jgi:predicted metal-dependent peptidase